MLVGLVLNFLGSLILFFGAFPSNETIMAMTRTRFGGNVDLVENFQENRLYAMLGLGLTTSGFLSELLGFLGSKKKDWIKSTAKKT